MTTDRALTPIVGVALLLALTVVAATAVGAVALALDPPAQPPVASFSLTVDASSEALILRHRSGTTVSVPALRLVVTVSGQALDHQPPVPFFAAEGFRSGPTGPFNSGADPNWSAGERGRIRLAATNDPLPDPGDTVTVRLVADGATIATLRAVAT